MFLCYKPAVATVEIVVAIPPIFSILATFEPSEIYKLKNY